MLKCATMALSSEHLYRVRCAAEMPEVFSCRMFRRWHTGVLDQTRRPYAGAYVWSAISQKDASFAVDHKKNRNRAIGVLPLPTEKLIDRWRLRRSAGA